MTDTIGDAKGPVLQVNLKLTRDKLDIYRCPSDTQTGLVELGSGRPLPFWFAIANYVGIADSDDRFQKKNIYKHPDPTYSGNGMLYNISSTRFADVKDGTSTTLMVGEATGGKTASGGNLGFGFVWMQLADLHDPINAKNSGVGEKFTHPGIPGGAGFSSHHTGGAHFLLVDGSVRFISETINHATYQNLGTRAGGEVVSGF